MRRRIAVVGDKLEHGGEILPYRGRVFTMGAGYQAALIGGYAYCEACKSTGIRITRLQKHIWTISW